MVNSPLSLKQKGELKCPVLDCLQNMDSTQQYLYVFGVEKKKTKLLFLDELTDKKTLKRQNI